MRCWVWPTTSAVSPAVLPAGACRPPGTVWSTAVAMAGFRLSGAAAAPGGTPALREVSEGFAAILWEEVLKGFQKAMVPNLTGMAGGSVYAGLALQVLAREMAHQAGLADFLYRALADRPQEVRRGKEIALS